MKLYRGGTRLAGTDGTFMPAVESVWVMVAAVIETSEVSGRDVHIIRVPRFGCVPVDKCLRAIVGDLAPGELLLQDVVGRGKDEDMGDVAKRL